jgi:hypothetical protein
MLTRVCVLWRVDVISVGAFGFLAIIKAQRHGRCVVGTMLKWRSARRHLFGEMRPMDDVVIATHLENLDRRLARMEQILPTLATKDELKTLATKDELKTLATKEELRSLGTELRQEIREEGKRSRRHMDIIGEALRSDIQLLAEHVASSRPTPPEG